MSRWSRCPFCRKRGHDADSCPSLGRTMGLVSEEDISDLMKDISRNPQIAEEMNRRKAHRHYGTDPAPRRVPRWRKGFRR